MTKLTFRPFMYLMENYDKISLWNLILDKLYYNSGP